MTAQGSNLSALPTLGVGLGFREPYFADLFLRQGDVDFLEIVADHFMDASARKRQELDVLAAHFPLIPHGLNLSLGSAEGIDPIYLAKFAALVDRLQPPWWSEHIAFTHAGGIDIGHLAPLPFTRESVDVVCHNVGRVQERIAAPLILENITYSVELPGAEMTEGQFLSEITERTGCGLLLDVTNLYTNAANGISDLEACLDQIPWDRVVQLHFVGGDWNGPVLIDSHSAATPPEVWALLERVLSRCAVKGVILERDENLPPFAELAAEMVRARQIGRDAKRWA